MLVNANFSFNPNALPCHLEAFSLAPKQHNIRQDSIAFVFNNKNQDKLGYHNHTSHTHTIVISLSFAFQELQLQFSLLTLSVHYFMFFGKAYLVYRFIYIYFCQSRT